MASGELAGAARRARRRWGLVALLVLAPGALAPLVWVAAWLAPFPEEALQRPPSPLRLLDNGRFLLALSPDDKRRLPLGARPLPAHLIAAVLAYEDRRFFEHAGVDLRAVMRAALQNLRAGRVVSGASTIPMQLARQMEPGPRTFGNKLRQAFRALQLEQRYTKGEILRLYFDLAPYGGNVEGIATAARLYFQKEPAALTLAEAALLAVVPSAPARLRPDRPTPELLFRQRAVLRRMVALGLLDEDEAWAALKTPLRRHPIRASWAPAPRPRGASPNG